jgi:predicted PurR-regulated permease PerM
MHELLFFLMMITVFLIPILMGAVLFILVRPLIRRIRWLYPSPPAASGSPTPADPSRTRGAINEND